METKPTKSENTPQETLVEEQARLNALIWNGEYAEALPLADKVLAQRSEQGERISALISYASVYYSAASRLWKEKGMMGATEVGRCMNVALRALEERILGEIEKQGGKKEGLIPVSLDALSADELDVLQAVYRQAAEMADRIPLAKPLRELILTKEADPVRDFDAAALLALRAGLKKVGKEEGTDSETSHPHTEIFLQAGSFSIAKRYGWEEVAKRRAERVYELADAFPWPDTEVSPENVQEHLTEYGQAARVARHIRDVAIKNGDTERAKVFSEKAEALGALVPDQKAKL